MEGRGLVARDNVIYNAAANGLACLGCIDTLIESNIVQRADGTGIYVAGEQITVRDNTVNESYCVPRMTPTASGFSESVTG